MTARIIVSGVTRSWQGQQRAAVNVAYVAAIIAAGAIPLIASPLIGDTRVGDVLDGADGLLLTGGEDVDPALYRQTPSPLLGATDRARDLFEIALFSEAHRRGIPVLAICRGIQVVNVALGGTLWQDLASERPGPVEHATAGARDARTHAVRVQHGTRVAEAVGTTQLAVNSFHHQAIRDLAPGLVAAAWAPDGLVEAVESAEKEPWLLGIQWHPEEMHADATAPDRGLFAALVREAVSARGRSTADSLR